MTPSLARSIYSDFPNININFCIISIDFVDVPGRDLCGLFEPEIGTGDFQESSAASLLPNVETTSIGDSIDQLHCH